MKLERLHEYVLITVVTTIGVVLAAFAGKLSGAGDTKVLGLLTAVIVFTIIGISMRERIWILIPITWCADGSLPFLPLPFTLREIAVLLAFVWFLVFKAVKIVRKKPTYEFLDIVVLVNVIYLASVFVRNPVGVDALGSARVGGRPYFVTIVAFLAYWVFCRAELNLRDARRLPFYLVCGYVLDAMVGLITYLAPWTVAVVGRLYSAVFVDDTDISNVSSDDSVSRLFFLGGFGQAAIQLLCSYFRPITILAPVCFWRFALTAISVILILMAGFRTGLVFVAFMLVTSSYFQKRGGDILRMALCAAPLLALLIAMHGVLFQLPIPAQRALSFLPGHWSEEAKESARDSTEWRFYMWKVMLTEHKYIDSRWLGDGFGFTRQQWVGMTHANAEGGAQESFLITGQVHSGPLSAIKIVGIVGFSLFLVLLMVSAKEVIGIIRRAWGTPYFPAAIFIGISVVYKVIDYNFIFGSFDGDFPRLVFFVGLIKLVNGGLRAYLETESAHQAEERLTVGSRPVLLQS